MNNIVCTAGWRMWRKELSLQSQWGCNKKEIRVCSSYFLSYCPLTLLFMKTHTSQSFQKLSPWLAKVTWQSQLSESDRWSHSTWKDFKPQLVKSAGGSWNWPCEKSFLLFYFLILQIQHNALLVCPSSDSEIQSSATELKQQGAGGHSRQEERAKTDWTKCCY